MQLTALPAMINTVAMSLGFGVLILSQVPANARLGLLVVLGLVNCLIISLLVLPELLAFRPPARTEKEPSLAISGTRTS
jgi:predicted RND superfamily exporter protein